MANEGSMPDPLVGLCFGKDDRLEVQRRLGQGGMGVVYYAWDEEKQRAVAIKVLLRQRADDPEFLRRFKHEGLRWKDIRHPALCRIYGLGRQHGYFYIVSEFVEGRDLDRVLQEDGAQPVDEALRIISEAAGALQVVHDCEIVHRDLKPENIMLRDKDRAVKVMDFGLAKYLATDSILTMPGDFVGTPGYVAPEHLRGDEMDGRADVFALGAILYELLTARGAFRGKHVIDVLRKNRDKDPIPVTKFNNAVVRPVATLIQKMIQKDPRRRPESMAVVVSEIESIKAQLAAGSDDERKGLGGLLKSFWE
jgi:serine/threonine-protein kinase